MNLWVEKYRPKSLDEMVEQDQAVRLLRSILETRAMPHLIFKGPAGTGKTSAAHILVRHMFPPPESLEDRVLELNASEERGIRTVRGKIKRFVSASVPEAPGAFPFNVVILDEADALTLDSQYALRRIIEDSSRTSRFILICNYINGIIAPLLSRCSVIHFNNLSSSTIQNILGRICDKEGIDPELQVLALNHSRHDARKAVNHLQRLVTCKVLVGAEAIDWPSFLAFSPSELLSAVQNLIYDGHDADTLLEHFISWAATPPNPPLSASFVNHALQICCNVANHGTPIIQLSSLIMTYAAAL